MTAPEAMSDPDRTARAITGKADQAVRGPTLELRQGLVVAVDGVNQRVDITLGGGTEVITGVVHLDAYLPAVNDVCYVLVNGPDLLVLDRHSAPGQAPGWPFGHAGRTGGFQDISGGWDVDGRYITCTAQQLRGGFQFSSNGLVIPRRGLYQVSLNGYWSGGGGYTGLASVVRNSTSTPPPVSARLMNCFGDKGTAQDATAYNQVTVALNAGDVLRLWQIGPNSAWGTTGYDGAFFSAEYRGTAPA